MKYDKTIVLLNMRFSEFFSTDILNNITEKIRIIAIIDHQFKNKIPHHIQSKLGKIYILESNPKLGFLGEFNYQSLKDIIKSEIKLTNDLRIVCSDEFNLLNAGRIREEFNLEGQKVTEILPFRDKIKMKEILSSKNIRVPRFRYLLKEDTFDSLCNEIGLPFVVKPIDSCGSHGVCIINNATDFSLFKSKNTEYSGFEVEEFINGSLYHVDALVKHNEIHFICANKYMYPNFEFTLGRPLGSIPLDFEDPLAKSLIQFAKNSLSALEAKNLISHMELFVNDQNEIIFLEASARPPGALLGLTHPINFGINLMDEDFKLQTGIEIQTNTILSKEKAFFVLFPLRPGKIIKLNKPSSKSRFDMTWHVQVGDYIEDRACTNIVDKAAHAIFYNEDKLQLQSDFELIKNHQAIEVVA